MTEHASSRSSQRLDDFLRARPSLGRRASSFILVLENVIKVPLFKCQRCGECVLSRTAFVCSQRCPKRLRNGACGGTRPGGFCEVYPERRCIWNAIYRRAGLLGRRPFIAQVTSPHQWDLEKTAAWLNFMRGRIEGPHFVVSPHVSERDREVAERAGRESR